VINPDPCWSEVADRVLRTSAADLAQRYLKGGRHQLSPMVDPEDHDPGRFVFSIS
jgi:hypothetical protein